MRKETGRRMSPTSSHSQRVSLGVPRLGGEGGPRTSLLFSSKRKLCLLKKSNPVFVCVNKYYVGVVQKVREWRVWKGPPTPPLVSGPHELFPRSQPKLLFLFLVCISRDFMYEM